MARKVTVSEKFFFKSEIGSTMYKRYNIFFLSLTLFTFGISLWLYEKEQDDTLSKIQHRDTSFKNIDDYFTNQLTLFWPSLAGESPRFITKKGLKGLGWAEFPVYKVKRALSKQYGIQIVDWEMSSARLHEEFDTARRSICFYPYIWSNPAMEFSDDPNYLYSVGLQFEDYKVRSILIRKEEEKKFKRYYDAEGMLSISSLLANSEMKTNLIIGKDYSIAFRNTFSKDSDNKWQVRPEYLQNISLMVPSDNKQLLHMLSKGRIDYILSNLVTEEHFRMSGHKKTDFHEIIFERTNVQDVRSEELEYYSVRCNKHPLSYKILPIVNNLIREIRGFGTTIAAASHRSKIEPGYSLNRPSFDFFEARFPSQFSSGEIDYWMDQYELSKKFKLNENMGIIQKIEKPIKAVKLIKRKEYIKDRDHRIQKYFMKKSDAALILAPNKKLIDLALKNGLVYSTRNSYDAKVITDLPKHIDSEVKSLFNNIPTQEVILSEIDFINVKNLILIDLRAGATKVILKNIEHLSGLHILFPVEIEDLSFESKIFSSLEKLSLVGINLKKSNFSRLVKVKKLRYLDLSGSTVEDDKLLKVLLKHHKTLEVLKLSDQKKLFSPYFADVVGRLTWPKLRIIDISDSPVQAFTFSKLKGLFGPSLETLLLDGSDLDPIEFKKIIENSPNLRNLVSPSNALNSIEMPFVMPSNLEIAYMKNVGISWSNAKYIRFTGSLRKLNLSNNSLKDQGLRDIFSQFSGNLEEITISNVENSAKGIHEIFFPNGKAAPWLKSLSVLNLTAMKIDDEFIIKLSNFAPQIKELNLYNNFITDVAIDEFARFQKLKSLSLGQNFISNKGFKKLLNMDSMKSLEYLNLSNILSIDSMDLTNFIESNLKGIDISDNNFSEEDMIQILNSLPDSLEFLKISGNNISDISLNSLVNNMPSLLNFLEVNVNFNDSNLATSLFNNLPDNMLELYINKGKWNASFSEENKISFPNNLLSIRLGNIEWNKETSEKIAENFPREIVNLDLGGTKVTSALVEKMASLPRLHTVRYSLAHVKHKIFVPYGFTAAFDVQANQFIKALDRNPFALMATAGKTAWPKLHKNNVKKSEISLLYLVGSGVVDTIEDTLMAYDLSSVITLKIDNTKLTGKGIAFFLKSISKRARHVSFVASELKDGEVRMVIENIPKTVNFLDITGNKLTDDGVKLFQEWRKRQEKFLRYSVGLKY